MLLSTAIRRWLRRMPAIVFGVELNRILPLISKSAHVRHRVRVVPALSRRQAAEPVGGAGRSLAQDDRVIGHDDVQAVACLDTQFAPSLAWDHDLMLGTDLDA